MSRSDEGLTIPVDEFYDCHRLAAADFSDVVVRAGKDLLAVVHGAFTQVLHQERFRRAAGKCTRIAVHGHRGVLSGSVRAAAEDFREVFDRNVLVPELLPDRPADDRRDLWMGELDRTEKRVGLSDVRCRVLEYPDNKASLVLGRDRSVLPCCIKRREHSTLADHRREVEQPLGEERRSEVDRRYARPIEYALAQPMLTGGFARRIAACGYHGHVDDDLDAGFLGSLCELSGRLHEAWADRVAEVGTLHSVQRRTHGVEIEEVAKHDLSAKLLQLLRSLVGPMGERPHRVLFLE